MARPTYTATLTANNVVLQAMNGYLKDIEKTMKGLSSSQAKYTKEVKETIKVEDEINKALRTREAVLTKAMNEQTKFELLSKKSFKAYKEAGGNAFDFIDLALTSAKQQVKIFGVEAVLLRKIMYGFLPPGMFRAVNKLSTVFRFMGGALRKVGDNADEADNIFSKMTRGMIKGAVGLSKIATMDKGSFKGATEKFKNLEGKRLAKSKTLGFADYSKGEVGDQSKKVKKLREGPNTKENLDALSLESDKLKMMKEARKSRIKQEPRNLKASKFLEKAKGLGKFVGKALMFMGKIMIYVMLFLTIAYILWKTVGKTLIKAIEAAWPAIKEGLGFIGSMFMLVIDGFMDIFNGFFGKDGNFSDVIDGVIKIAVGLLGIGLGIIGTLLIALGGIVIEFTKIGVTRIIDWFAEIKNDWTKIFKSIPMILAIIALIVSFILGAPIWLAVLVFVVIYKFGEWIVKQFKKLIPGNAEGGVVSGLSIVGEKGPELVSFGSTARVHSNSDSKKMMRGSGTVNNFNITINAKDSSKAEMRRMADEIGRMVSSNINRSTSSNTMR